MSSEKEIKNKEGENVANNNEDQENLENEDDVYYEEEEDAEEGEQQGEGEGEEVLEDWEQAADEDPEEKERKAREAFEQLEREQREILLEKERLEKEMNERMEMEMKLKMEEDIKRLEAEDARKKEEERKKKAEEEAKKALEQTDPNAPKPKKKMNVNAPAFTPYWATAEYRKKFEEQFKQSNELAYKQQVDEQLKQKFNRVIPQQPLNFEEFKKQFATTAPKEEKKGTQVSGSGFIGVVKNKTQPVTKTTGQKAADPKAQPVEKKKVYKRLLPKDAPANPKPKPVKEEKLEEIPVDPSKYVEVDETRAPLNIVFIGHVDAGKSTTCGNILLLSGKVDLNELRKFELEAKEKHRESWYLAYIMDINEEERAKGKTVEVGKAHFQTEKKRFTILDAPGHKNYVPNMIAGAAQADIACLVISSKTGEFESGFEKGGQTKEHAMLAMSLGVKKMICLVNKMDDDKWSQKRFDSIKESVELYLEKSCGYAKDAVSWIPISGLHGDNIQKPLDPKACPWYKGPTLFELLDNLPVPDRNPNAPLRIPVLDKMRDQGLFVFGKIEAGIIKTNMNVCMMPYKKEFTILEIFNAEDNRVMYAKPGENVKIRVRGLEDDDIKKGYMISNYQEPCQVCSEFEAKLQILELPEHKPIMSQGYTCVLHLHTSVEEVEITTVVSLYDNEKGKYVKSSFLKSGVTGQARILCKSYLCLEKFEASEHLGRFTLRDEGRTIAIGYVEKIKPAGSVKRENNETSTSEKK